MLYYKFLKYNHTKNNLSSKASLSTKKLHVISLILNYCILHLRFMFTCLTLHISLLCSEFILLPLTSGTINQFVISAIYYFKQKTVAIIDGFDASKLDVSSYKKCLILCLIGYNLFGYTICSYLFISFDL